MKKIGIIGSRTRNTYQDFIKVYQLFQENYEEGDVIVSGGCPKGGDRFAEIIAMLYGKIEPLHDYKQVIEHYIKNPKDGDHPCNIPMIIHKPDRSLMNPFDKTNPKLQYKKICLERNTLIAEDSDILIACLDEENGGGTKDTIKKFRKHRNDCDIFIC